MCASSSRRRRWVPAGGRAGRQAERDVVQERPVADPADVDATLDAAVERAERGDRVVAVEADVAREVIARAERDADERQAALDRHRGHRRKRAVAARDAQDLGVRRARERGDVVPRREHVRVEPTLASRPGELLRLGKPDPARGLTNSRPSTRAG